MPEIQYYAVGEGKFFLGSHFGPFYRWKFYYKTWEEKNVDYFSDFGNTRIFDGAFCKWLRDGCDRNVFGRIWNTDMLWADIFDDEGSGKQLEEAADGDSDYNVISGGSADLDCSLLHNKRLEAHILVLHSHTAVNLPHPDSYLFQGNTLLSDPTASD